MYVCIYAHACEYLSSEYMHANIGWLDNAGYAKPCMLMYVCMYLCVYVCMYESISSEYMHANIGWLDSAGYACSCMCVCMCVCVWKDCRKYGQWVHACQHHASCVHLYLCVCVSVLTHCVWRSQGLLQCMCMYVCLYDRIAEDMSSEYMHANIMHHACICERDKVYKEAMPRTFSHACMFLCIQHTFILGRVCRSFERTYFHMYIHTSICT
jgi:hypothetical protein